MGMLDKILIASTLAVGGCHYYTDQEQCAGFVERLKVTRPGRSCDTIYRPEAKAECNRLLQTVRESALAACLTASRGTATVCREAKEGTFDCNDKK